jgi:hypothetical protein
MPCSTDVRYSNMWNTLDHCGTATCSHSLTRLQELRISCSVSQMERRGGVSPVVSPFAQVRPV